MTEKMLGNYMHKRSRITRLSLWVAMVTPWNPMMSQITSGLENTNRTADKKPAEQKLLFLSTDSGDIVSHWWPPTEQIKMR